MPFTYGNLDRTAADSRNLTDKNIGPLLVVWLWLVTNPDWQTFAAGDPLSADGIALATKLDLTPETVMAIRDHVLADPVSFASVATQFQSMASVGSYPVGNTCPRAISTLLALAH